MPRFLTTKATASSIEEIIRGAKKEIYLISPYLKLSVTFLERLMDADGKGLKIHIVFGKKELRPGELEKLHKLKNLQLYFCENLHAKCYFNESEMVISSMNMYEFSEVNNKEMGVGITLAQDPDIYNSARDESLHFLKFSMPQNVQVPVAAVVAQVPGLDYRNWKERLYAELNKKFSGHLDFHDNGEELNIHGRDHNLNCYIEEVRGKNILKIDKILSGKLLVFLKASEIQRDLPPDSSLELVEGKNGAYAMAFYTLKLPLRSARLNYVYPQDLQVIYGGILAYSDLMDRFVKEFESSRYKAS